MRLLKAAVHIVKRLKLGVLLPQHISLEPPRSSFACLVSNEPATGDSEDVIELFQSPLLCLWNKQEDHDERANIQSSVEAKGTYDVSASLTSN